MRPSKIKAFRCSLEDSGGPWNGPFGLSSQFFPCNGLIEDHEASFILMTPGVVIIREEFDANGLAAGPLPRLPDFSYYMHLLRKIRMTTARFVFFVFMRIHCVSTAYSLRIHCVSTAYSLRIYCAFTVRLLAHLVAAHPPRIHCASKPDC